MFNSTVTVGSISKRVLSHASLPSNWTSPTSCSSQNIFIQKFFPRWKCSRVWWELQQIDFGESARWRVSHRNCDFTLTSSVFHSRDARHYRMEHKQHKTHVLILSCSLHSPLNWIFAEKGKKIRKYWNVEDSWRMQGHVVCRFFYKFEYCWVVECFYFRLQVIIIFYTKFHIVTVCELMHPWNWIKLYIVEFLLNAASWFLILMENLIIVRNNCLWDDVRG